MKFVTPRIGRVEGMGITYESRKFVETTHHSICNSVNMPKKVYLYIS